MKWQPRLNGRDIVYLLECLKYRKDGILHGREDTLRRERLEEVEALIAKLRLLRDATEPDEGEI